MSTWKPASTVFLGGTEQIKTLIGARVRTRTHLGSCALFDPIRNTQGTTDLPIGSVGFVTNSRGPNLLIAFPVHPGAMPSSLASLQRGGITSFKVVIVNEPTFKLQFEVERA